MVDFVAAQQLAVRLINENGRGYELFVDIAGAGSDPIRGGGTGTKGKKSFRLYNKDEVEKKGRGVFVPPSGAAAYGLPGLGEATGILPDLFRESKEVLIIPYPTDDQIEEGLSITPTPAADSNNLEFILSEFTCVRDLDSGKVWGITATQVLQPGEVKVLAYIGLKD